MRFSVWCQLNKVFSTLIRVNGFQIIQVSVKISPCSSLNEYHVINKTVL